MKSQTGQYVVVVAAFVALAVVAPAAAQSEQTPPAAQPLETADDPPAQTQSAPRVLLPPAPIRQPYWSASAGFEADTHDSGYGFAGPTYVRPFRPNMAVVAGANLNYLYYEYPTGGGHTNVRSPGINTRAGLRFGDRNYFQLAAGPGFKRRHIEIVDASGAVIESSRNTKVGLNIGADLWVNPTSHSNVFGLASYNTEDQYLWSRLAFREQITNHDWSGGFAHFVGVEAIGQGNQDIRSTQVGAFFEVAHVPSSMSVMVRGGYKRSFYDFGPDRTGPWVAIGVWHRLR